jgi:hypothetical protein
MLFFEDFIKIIIILNNDYLNAPWPMKKIWIYGIYFNNKNNLKKFN